MGLILLFLVMMKTIIVMERSLRKFQRGILEGVGLLWRTKKRQKKRIVSSSH